MPAAYPSERREVRFTIAADVLTEDIQTRVQKTGKVENISRSGCFVSTKDPWIQWTRIRLWIVYRGQQFCAEGSVVHSAGARGMGVEFESIGPADSEMLAAWLTTLPST